MNKWIETPENKNEDHWVDLIFQDEEGNHWNQAAVKWDGCIHLWRGYNTPLNKQIPEKNDADYIHICDLYEYIQMLVGLKEKALDYFKEHGMEWPDL